jgi:hypothetical protein
MRIYVYKLDPGIDDYGTGTAIIKAKSKKSADKILKNDQGTEDNWIFKFSTNLNTNTEKLLYIDTYIQ